MRSHLLLVISRHFAGAGRVGGGGQHWGDPPAAARSPGRAGGADAADAALPLAAFLDLLREDGTDVIRTADALPFANALAAAPLAGSRNGSGDGSDMFSPSHRDSFLQSSVQRWLASQSTSPPSG